MGKKRRAKEFYMNCRLIDDLPPRVETILNCMVEGVDLPEDFVLPEHDLFLNDNWQNYLIRPAVELPIVTYSTIKDGRLLFCQEVTEGDDLMADFIDWIYAYVRRGRGKLCIGHYKGPDEFPTLILVKQGSLSFLKTDSIFGHDGVVIVDNEEGSSVPMPKAKDIKAAVSGHLDDLMEKLGAEKIPVPPGEN